MCSSVVYAPLFLYDLAHVGMGRVWKQPAISEILARAIPKQFAIIRKPTGLLFIPRKPSVKISLAKRLH
jgi:hypothetical protein